MKKMMKRIGAVLLAVAMMAAVSVTAWAAGHSSITINNAVAGHTYTAYQILSGNYSEGTLSNVDWGNGISATGQSALETLYNVSGAPAVAGAIAEDSATDPARKVAEAIGTSVVAANGKTGSFNDGSKQYTISDLDDGYYIIVDTYTPAEGETNVTISRYMVDVAGNAEINNKAETPTVDKTIVEDGKDVDQNTANIGDEVNFKITSAVPDMTGYKEYYMDFNDTLSKGLTYKADSLSVSIGGTTLNANAYTLSVGDYSATNGTSIVVHLKDMVSRKYEKDAAIVITYTATVNDKAVIGNAGNPNTVNLEYSNNPQNSGDGQPDNDNDGVQGKTPDSTTNTFVTGIELTKLIKDTDTPLAGAVFNVKGTQINKVLITGDHYVVAEAGTFYKLTDGTYTDKEPTTATQSSYASTTTKYSKQAYATTSQQEAANVNFEVISGADGKIVINGLKEGTYTFTEIQAPSGYNLLSEPITVVVESNIATITSATDFEWSVGSGSSNTVSVKNGVFVFDVENAKGTELPSTGGIGTYVFTIAGAAIMAVAAGLLVIRRKKA